MIYTIYKVLFRTWLLLYFKNHCFKCRLIVAGSKCVCVIAPCMLNDRKCVMEDLAILTRGKVGSFDRIPQHLWIKLLYQRYHYVRVFSFLDLDGMCNMNFMLSMPPMLCSCKKVRYINDMSCKSYCWSWSQYLLEHIKRGICLNKVA